MNKNIIFFKKTINCINFKELYKKNTINNLGYVKLIKEENMNIYNNNCNNINCSNNCHDLMSYKYKVTFNLSNNTQKTYRAIYYKKFGQLFFFPP
jgi:hypothetical protein